MGFKPRDLNNSFRLLKAFLNSPKGVGSITPSSDFLVNKIVNEVDWGKSNTIVELGSGTGVITDKINKNKNKSSKLILFEKNDKLKIDLQAKYPKAKIFQNALELDTNLNSIGIHKADIVISSLPLSFFSSEDKNKIISLIYKSLKKNGIFIMFQYSWQLKNVLDNTFKECKLKFIMFNIPPAFLYVCKK